MARTPRRGTSEPAITEPTVPEAVSTLADAGFAPVDPNAEQSFTGGAIDPNAPVMTATAATVPNGRSTYETPLAQVGEKLTIRGIVTHAPTQGRVVNGAAVTNFLLRGPQVDRAGVPVGHDRDWNVQGWRELAEAIQREVLIGDEIEVFGKWQEPRQVALGVQIDNEVNAYSCYRPLGAQMADRSAVRATEGPSIEAPPF